jgi:hypothetical protein
MLLPLPKVKVQKVVAKVGIAACKGAGPLLTWVSLDFCIFPCTWKLLPPYMLLLGGVLAMWAN